MALSFTFWRRGGRGQVIIKRKPTDRNFTMSELMQLLRYTAPFPIPPGSARKQSFGIFDEDEDELAKCTRCGHEGPPEDFYMRGDNGAPTSWCKKCTNDNHRERMEKAKLKKTANACLEQTGKSARPQTRKQQTESKRTTPNLSK
jgi:hypothetical protein